MENYFKDVINYIENIFDNKFLLYYSATKK